MKPEWLDDYGAAKWDEIEAGLGQISSDIHDAVCLYCEAYQEFREALLVIRQEGTTCVSEKGGVYQHPQVGIKNRAIERMRQLGPKIGWREGKGTVKPQSKGVATRQRK